MVSSARMFEVGGVTEIMESSRCKRLADASREIYGKSICDTQQQKCKLRRELVLVIT